MRKNIKRLVAVLVVMAMIISMCSTAFAAGHSKNKPSRGSHKSATKEVTNPATDPIVEESADTAAPEDQAVDETAETTPEETTVSEETNYVTETAEETAPAAEEAADDAVTVADDAEETAPAEVTYPATEFDSDEIAGVIVHVDAPEGALPEGTTMKVSKVNLDAVQDAVDKADDITGTVVAAVDITFFDANGEEIEPNTDITVTMTSDEIAKAGDPKVVHVDVKADEIEDADVAAENVEAEAEDDAVAFDADQFSVYAIVDGSTADGRYRATYYFQNADGSPYYFQNTAGETVNNQILKDGETLENVGVPNIDVTDETFNGWYYWTEDGGYGSEVQFGAVSVTGNDTIYIRANVGEVAYLTFYEDAEGTIILDRVQVPVGTQYDISQKQLPAPESELAFVGWNESAGHNDDARTAIESTTITVNGNKAFYPVFKSAHWIRFISAPVGSGATYIAPAFVLAGKTASDAEPETAPIWKGHRFLGWSETEDSDPESENSFVAYNFNQVLSTDVTLHAHWTAAEATYTVQYWKQNITDDKNASNDAKTYSFASQTTRRATAGSTVGPTSEDMNKASTDAADFKGFVYNAAKTDTSVTVNADGTTVLNVYYDRQLITFKFYKDGTNTQAPGYNSQYYNTTTGSNRVTVYTGLYGQPLDKYNYSWPDGMYIYYYNNGDNTRGISFLGEFVPPSMLTNGETEVRMYYSGTKVATIEFYLQNVDGSYPSTPNNYGVSSGGNFNLAEKYEAYNVVSYRRYTGNHNWVENDYVPGGVGTEVTMSYTTGYWNSQTHYYNLAVRYARKSHTLKYLDSVDGTELSGVQSASVVYGASLSDKKPADSFVPVSQTPGKVWDGKWYKDQACTVEFDWSETMPNADVNVYAGWEDVWYWVKVDPNEGELHGSQSTWFWETYGELAVEYGDISRDYVEDASGDYYYHYDEFNESDPDGTQPSTRRAYYTTEFDQASSATKYRAETDAYALIGWYDITDGVENAKPYNFSTPITKNLILQARWRRVGEFKVKYDVSGYLKDEEGNLTEDSSVVGTSAPNDTSKYADGSDSSILSPITPPAGYVFVGWYYKDTEMNPGDVFKVDADDADAEKTIHIKPIYQKYEDQPVPVTHIDFYANYQDVSGLPIEGVTDETQGKFSYENIQINKGYDIKDVTDVIAKGTADADSYDGYTFLGWAKKADATEADLFLKYEDGVFKAKDDKGAWTEVTQVGADEDQSAGSYDDLYAVWQGSFKVYHSGVAGGNVETIKYSSKTYDLTNTPAGLTSGTLYGGYYLEGGFTMPEGETTPAYDGDNWTWTKAETVSGKAITPKCGETYYIKEVPATKFLQPYTHYTYYKSNNNITNLWMISDIDDTMYDETGFIITKNDEAKVCKSLTVKNQVGGASVKLTPKKVFGSKGATANDYLTYCEESGLITTTDGTPVAITMYWITPDKITVTGTTQRIISDGSNKDTISKTDEPISSTIN